MKRTSVIVTCITALLSVLLSVALLLLAKQPAYAPRITDLDGDNEIAATRINEIGSIGRLQYANYTADEFVSLPLYGNMVENADLPSGKLVDLARHQPDSYRGSYQFVLSYPQMTDDVTRDEYIDSMRDFLDYDGNFHVMIYIPPIYSAAVIYADGEAVAKIGDIKDYDFTEYNPQIDSEKATVSETHTPSTEGVYVELTFQDGNNAGNTLWDSKLLTIHFEGSPNLYAGMRGTPLIGAPQKVRGYVAVHRAFTVTLAITAAIVIATFTLMCILRRTLHFLPQLFVAMGILLASWSRASMIAFNFTPHLWGCIGFFGLAFVTFGAACSLRVKTGKFPLWLPVAVVAGVNCLMHFIMPLVPPTATAALHIYRVVVGILLGAVLLILALICSVRDPNHPYSTVIPVLGATLTAVTPFVQTYDLLLPSSPVTYLFAAALAATLILGIREYIKTERRVRYLEANLTSEVQRRTNNLKSIIDERDKLLRYVSHDIRKPVSSVKRFAGELMTTEKDENRKRQLQVICDKVTNVEQSLLELQKYSKLNFSPEQPHRCDVFDLLDAAYKQLSPDCAASDIILHPNSAHIQAYCREQTIAQVLNNLIFNCIDHANCRNVYLSATRSGSVCSICVTDDGVGAENSDTMFDAYTTKGSEENFGLGLYICRDLMRDMGGELDYSRKDDKTVFTLTLPLA